jgi:hypothetical protein
VSKKARHLEQKPNHTIRINKTARRQTSNEGTRHNDRTCTTFVLAKPENHVATHAALLRRRETLVLQHMLEPSRTAAAAATAATVAAVAANDFRHTSSKNILI